MKRFSITSADGTVVNIVVAEKLSDVTVEDGFQVRLITDELEVAIGGRLVDGGFIPKDVPEPAAPGYVNKLNLVRAMRRIDLWEQFKTSMDSAALEIQEDWMLASNVSASDFVVFSAGLGLTSKRQTALFLSATR